MPSPLARFPFTAPTSVLLGCMLLLTAAFGPQANAQVFNNWQLACEASRVTCYVSQNTSLTETGQRVLRAVAGNLGPEEQPVLHLTVPLGIYIPLGVALRVDAGPQRKAEVHTCTSDGCEAVLPLDAELLAALTGGQLTQVAFLDAVTRRQITVAVPMAGFAQAYTALQQRAAR